MYKRFENETDEELIYRITSDKELIGSWQKVADILNELLGTNYTESKFRKERRKHFRPHRMAKVARRLRKNYLI